VCLHTNGVTILYIVQLSAKRIPTRDRHWLAIQMFNVQQLAGTAQLDDSQ
jgi:hypothetical protein